MRWFWIDCFTEFVSDSHAVAVKNVSLAEPHMHDHFLGYPLMPNSLVTEGIAQAGGLLVSEHYGFNELVVLAKLAHVRFFSHVRPGESLTYRVHVDSLRADGAVISGTAHVGERLHGEAQMFFAKLSDSQGELSGARLFSPIDLRNWLSLVGVFKVGVHQDGTRIVESDYAFEQIVSTASN